MDQEPGEVDGVLSSFGVRSLLLCTMLLCLAVILWGDGWIATLFGN